MTNIEVIRWDSDVTAGADRPTRIGLLPAAPAISVALGIPAGCSRRTNHRRFFENAYLTRSRLPPGVLRLRSIGDITFLNAALEWTETLGLITHGRMPDEVYNTVRQEFDDPGMEWLEHLGR